MPPVSETKKKELQRRMDALGLKESDIREHFVRSSGPGGQKVNKASTCVVLKHIPTGIEVKCQQERSQTLNRYLARRILVDKLEVKILGEKSKAQKQKWKIKKQKQKRNKRAKEKILKEKKKQSEKKSLRKHVWDYE
ncbi:MAG: peptide chain release factor-like protein [Pseudomonadota bacterium]